MLIRRRRFQPRKTQLRNTLFLGLVLLLTLSGVTPVEAGAAKDLYKEIKKAVRGEEHEEALRLAVKLSKESDPQALEYLWRVGYELGNRASFHAGVLDLLRGMEGVMSHSRERLESGAWTEQVFVCDVVTEVDSEEARALLIQALRSGKQFVELASIDGLEKTLHRDAVLPLISKLEELTKGRKRDLLYYRVGDALFNLTGNDFELIEEWHDWWEPVQNSFDPAETDTGGQTGVVRNPRRGKAAFGDCWIDSTRICFVIDTSGSMRYVMKDDIPGLARGTGEDGGGSSGGGDMTQEDRRLAQFWTRMEMAKRALIQCVSRLEPGTLFNIVRFNSSADKYKGRAITASKSSRKAACRWVEDTPFKNGGATNTLQALEYAFSQDSETNTIYFLSDGLPSRDGVNPDPTGPILDRVFELNRFRKVRIHTFGFDERVYSTGRPDPDLKAANDWLRRLAEETGGSFSQLRVDTKYTPDDPYGRGKKAEGDVARRPAGQSAR